MDYPDEVGNKYKSDLIIISDLSCGKHEGGLIETSNLV